MNETLGQLLPFAANFSPEGWLRAQGGLLPINAYLDLFEFLGNQFGGDGRDTFGLPNVSALASNPGIPWVISTDGAFPRYMLGLLAEVRLWDNTSFMPSGWVPCDGSLLPINTNQALYSVIGTAFGGDGQSNFAVPKLPSPGAGLQYLLATTGIYPSQGTGYPQVEYLLSGVTMFAGNYAPQGFIALNGPTLPLNQNLALFSLFGTTWGGDGIRTFQLPSIPSLNGVGYYTPLNGIYPSRP